MTIHFKTSIWIAAVMSVTSVGFAEEMPAPNPVATPDPALTQDQVDHSSLEKFAREFDLLPGLGRPRGSAARSSPTVDLGPDPLGEISSGMTGVHADLSQFKTDRPVQQKEQEVVNSLDQLIAALTPKCGGSGGGNTPGAGRKRSGIFEGDPRFGELHDVSAQGRQWAQLPPKERERILQSRTEGFPPGFESLLQSYYQRLAQEKPADEKAADSPTTQPGTH